LSLWKQCLCLVMPMKSLCLLEYVLYPA